MPTLFERIISGELPASIVYKDDRVTAFRDIHPRAPTHILIVPNKPIPTANDVTAADESLVGHMVLVVAQIGLAQIATNQAVAASASPKVPDPLGPLTLTSPKT